MPKEITVRVCPQCAGDCKPVAGTYNWQCADCGWTGETCAQELDSEKKPTGRIALRRKVVI